MEFYRNTFNNVGWFIPPYVNRLYLQKAATVLLNEHSPDLETVLRDIYTPMNLASMVTERYSISPFIKEYKNIISESIQAHFLGLDHIAVSGLMPVVEGVGKELVDYWGISRTYKDPSNRVRQKGIRALFSELIKECKKYINTHQLGQVHEVISTLDAFEHYLDNNFYTNSSNYLYPDNTNRHGILHGFFKDEDYGAPLNFYKTIGAIDLLCFIVSFKASISFLAPEPTNESQKVGLLYIASIEYRKATIKAMSVSA